MGVLISYLGSGNFDDCSFHSAIGGTNTHSLPWKSIWCTKVPKRVSFFLWSATCGKILTIDNLIKRGLWLVNWCCMCHCSGEIVDHLLIQCEIVYALLSVYDFWDSLGVAKQGSIPSFWIEQLIWKTFLGCMEFGDGLGDVVSVEGKK